MSRIAYVAAFHLSAILHDLEIWVKVRSRS